ncbi:MAG: hypothetical protein ACKO2B_00870 [Betaproteobacteria bacterium]
MTNRKCRPGRQILALSLIALGLPTAWANPPRPFVGQSAEQRERFCSDRLRLACA